MYDMKSILHAQSLYENGKILKQGDYTFAGYF